jgi:hypothetical protein
MLGRQLGNIVDHAAASIYRVFSGILVRFGHGT